MYIYIKKEHNDELEFMIFNYDMCKMIVKCKVSSNDGYKSL